MVLLGVRPQLAEPDFRGTGLSEDAMDLARAFWRGTTSHSVEDAQRQEGILELLSDAFIEWTASGGQQPRGLVIIALSYALSLIVKLPRSVPLPEVWIDSDGDVALDWDYDAARTLSVRISHDGTIVYAGLLGQSTVHGTDVLTDRVPSGVTDAIARIVFRRR